MEIKIIEPHLTYGLRHQILRPHQAPEACHYPLDFELSSLHLGAYQDETLISIASFFQENHPDLEAAKQYRLRGMATLMAFRNKGVGRALLQVAERELLQKQADLWWCNARVSAASYYAKLGLQPLGIVFDLPPIGPHQVMVRYF
ncbi:MAG: GNAT family N-acetyltransferase [Bacteroidota bacterium]